MSHVTITDFRTFGEIQLDLPNCPGLLIVSGPNGLGKTSFFDALEWCLTGKVQRFIPFLKRGNTEADYLTREGAEPRTHRVELVFGEAQTILRVGGGEATSADEVTSILASPSWSEAIQDLSTYLALTHFLGQASHQRFTSRAPSEQWRALRVPTGVERLEQIRRRLRGRSAMIALNRRVDATADEVRQRDERLARWDGLVERHRRLGAVARAAGALPREQIIEQASDLCGRLSLLVGEDVTKIAAGVDATEILNTLREKLLQTQRNLASRENTLQSVDRLPEQHLDLVSKIAAVEARIDSLHSTRSNIDARLQAHAKVLEQTDLVRRQQVGRVQRMTERVSLLRAAHHDLLEGAAAESRERLASSELAKTGQEEGKVRLELEALDARLQALQTKRDAVRALDQRYTDLTMLRQEASVLAELDAQAEAARRRLNEVSKVSLFTETEASLRNERDKAAAELRERQAELARGQARVGTITAAVSAIAAHLTDHDQNCPVCRTAFREGELKALAEQASQDQDAALLAQESLVERATAALAAIEQRLAELLAVQERERVARAEAERVQSAAADARRTLLAKLDLRGGDPAAVVTQSLSIIAARRDVETRQLSAQEAEAVETQQRRTQISERLARLKAQAEEQKAAAERAAQDRAAAADRFEARLGDEDVDRNELPGLLARAETEGGEATAALNFAEAQHAAEAATVATIREEQEANTLELTERERARNELERARRAIEDQWVSKGLPSPPSISDLEEKLTSLRSSKSKIAAIDEERQSLMAALEAALAREELEAARRAIANEANGAPVNAHRAALPAALEKAQRHNAAAEAARKAIVQLAERLQNEANAFSEQFLRPLNDLISAFNDALLTTPGISVFFSADYFADRTDFSMRLRQRPGIGGAPVERKVDPQLVLSEGQLAANGFSILCSASVSYPWSSWRALLLDDPLQHNDVIHAAAFTDVMRNLVELEKYQVLMSSHDRAETEFIERKFTAADLPCTVCQLTADSPDGVLYEIKANAPALGRLKRGSARTAS